MAVPSFTPTKPNPNPSTVTDALWWFWLQFKAHEPSVLLGGIYANKPGFHNTGAKVVDHGQGNARTDYSIRDKVNRSGTHWRDRAAAIDLTFPDAQRGNYATIARYSKRLYNSGRDAGDPRLGLGVYDFYGQIDNDAAVEGWNEHGEHDTTSDASHLWHIHISLLRSKVDDHWAMWALLTVLMGWSTAKWRKSLPADAPKPAPVPTPATPAKLPDHPLGKRTLSYKPSPNMLGGTDVLYVQKFIGPNRAGPADGWYGTRTRDGVRWYQRMRGITADGVVGKTTWAHLTGR